MIKVSVLIPAYNVEDSIERAIESVPDREDVDVIVWDDGSTDETRERIIEALGKREGKGWYGVNHENRGVSYSVNRLLEEADGEYVILLGGDDWFNDKFEEVMELLDGNVDLVYFDLEINDGSIFYVNEESKEGYCGSVKFMRREFVGNIRCREEKKAGEDRYFFQELLKKNPKEIFSGVVIKRYNYPREGSLSWKYRHGLFREDEI